MRTDDWPSVRFVRSWGFTQTRRSRLAHRYRRRASTRILREVSEVEIKVTDAIDNPAVELNLLVVLGAEIARDMLFV